MTTGFVRPRRVSSGRRAHSSGFSLIELMMTMLIGLILTLIALPLISNVTGYLRLRAAVSAVTGAIQTTRYNAIYNGYPYQVSFSSANRNYQVANEIPPATAFANVGTTIPYAVATNVRLNQDTAFQFNPSGVVTVITGTNAMTINVGTRVATIDVTPLGRVHVQYK